eukprot:CAMPEP_0194356032 /NCGR_PEP_ID=MMETSP0174-20130528/3839_1 /TAXON_ID=216777 /ORGANISM="Proboscia alata, Strain PI-D3" /LENGTH=142 /DNA_ID=CAMNT_0039125535 /DNA_START=21 /DNA_END=449 /DNA_ORIENTATION=+
MKLNFAVLFIAVTSVMGDGGGGGLRSGDGSRGLHHGGRNRDDDCTCEMGGENMCAVERCASKAKWQTWIANGKLEDEKPERRERSGGGSSGRWSHGGRDDCTCDETGAEGEVLCSQDRCARKAGWKAYADGEGPKPSRPGHD